MSRTKSILIFLSAICGIDISHPITTKRSGISHHMHIWAAFGVFLGALFLGQIFVPQFLVWLVPGLSFLFSNPAANLSFGSIFSFNVLGFIVTAAITLPFLAYFLKRAHAGTIAVQG